MPDPKDHSKQHYYETVESGGGYGWKIYHYDASGNKEIVVHRSEKDYDTEPEAEDACVEFMEEKGIDAEMG